MRFFQSGPSGFSSHARAIKVRTMPTQYPELRDDLRNKLSVIEHPHRRALRDRHRHGVRSARYRGGSYVAAAKPQWQLQVVRGRVDVASRREDHTLIRYHERPVQLGKLFERLAQVRILYALALVGVT